MNDLKAGDLIEQAIIGEQRQLMLKAKRSDPEVMTEAFAFFQRLRQGSDLGQFISNVDVVRNRIRIRIDHSATLQQLINHRIALDRLS